MATVTGFTAARMLEIEDNTVVDGSVVGNNLILEKHNGTTIDAGNVRGPQGIQGIPGEVTEAELTAAIDAEETARDAAILTAIDATKGWHHIFNANVASVSSFVIPIPASTYKMIRIIMSLQCATAAAAVHGRVNNNLDVGLHRYSYTQVQGDGTLSGTSVDSTSWRLGVANSTFASTFELLIMDTNASGLLPFHCVNTVFATTPANVRTNMSSGRLSAAHLISSLSVFGASELVSGFYTCEGYKI